MANVYQAGGSTGYKSQLTRLRLGTTYVLTGSGSNSHQIGGIGGLHEQSSWCGEYESSPSEHYCSMDNTYGRPGSHLTGHSSNNAASNGNARGLTCPLSGGGFNSPWGSNCFSSGATTTWAVEFAFFVALTHE